VGAAALLKYRAKSTFAAAQYGPPHCEIWPFFLAEMVDLIEFQSRKRPD